MIHLFQVPTKRRSKKAVDPRPYVFEYLLNEIKICKNVYCSVLGVSKDRVTYAVKQKKDKGINTLDKRGRKEPSNKIPLETIVNVRAFLDTFPKSRPDDSGTSKSCFSPNLPIQKMYRIYCERNNEQYKIGKTIFRKCVKEYENIYLNPFLYQSNWFESNQYSDNVPNPIEYYNNSSMCTGFELYSHDMRSDDGKMETVNQPIELCSAEIKSDDDVDVVGQPIDEMIGDDQKNKTVGFFNF